MILLLFGFWCSAVLLAWAYVGYPLFAATGLARVLRQPRRSAGAPTGCVLLVPAHNEQEVIEAKIRNGLALAWAGDGRLDVVVVSDGSTDRTEELARRYASQTDRVRLIVCPQRRGKNAALNAAVAELDPPPDCLLLFTDANAIFDTGAASELARVLEGGAACAIGKLTFVDAATDTARAEGLYWRYENWIKRSEGAVGRAIAANGAILAARRRDVPELPSGVPNDWWIPLTLLARDRRVEYAPAAEAVEAAPQRKGEEFSRKVRMANRQMTGVLRIWRDLDAATRFQVVSHKLLRWLGLPLILIATASGFGLALVRPAYLVPVALLLAPGVFALVSVALGRVGLSVPLGRFAVHFFLVHSAAFIGVWEAVAGRRRSTWDAAPTSRRMTR